MIGIVVRYKKRVLVLIEGCLTVDSGKKGGKGDRRNLRGAEFGRGGSQGVRRECAVVVVQG
jgi:hypothetical protein